MTEAKRVLKAERKSQFDDFTIGGDPATMGRDERAAIRRFDRAIAKIDAVLA